MISRIVRSKAAQASYVATRGLMNRPIVTSRLQVRPASIFQSSLRFYSDKSATIKVDSPQLMIAFTCKKCDTRSSHTFSKQAYTSGTVLIECPGCKGRHLIADNLKIFKDNRYNLEEVLKAKGESVATTTNDLAFEDIPESLRDTIGHHAKDAPEEYAKKWDNKDNSLPSGKE